MRSLIVSCNITVDGFMAGPDNDPASLGFIVADPEQENDLAARFQATVDTIVLGRQTFFVMENYWTKINSTMADWLNTTPKVVLSTDQNLDVSVWKNSTLAAGDGTAQLQRLKQTAGGAMVMFGGVQTIRTMAAADLVDEYWLKISPIAIGAGSSMFSELADHKSLKLRSVKGFPSGMIDATYTI